MSETPSSLSLLPYHAATIAFLQNEQAELWRWFSAQIVAPDQVASVRLDLLKSAFRMDPVSESRIHDLASEAANRLGCAVPVNLYHSQRSGDRLNASLAFLPDEAHVVLHGPVTEALTDSELQALLGHELAHFRLWTDWDGVVVVADQLLAALATDAAAAPAEGESYRRFRLYTEIFCDRGARVACGSLVDAVAALVTTETGVRELDPENYLNQLDDSGANSGAVGLTHPECSLRARALRLWDGQSNAADDQIRSLIEGEVALDQLDLLSQQQLNRSTRRLVDAYLAHKFLQTDRSLGHARLFFDGYEPSESSNGDDQLAAELETTNANLRDYYCYVLLDFVSAEPQLAEVALAAALLLTERLNLVDRFDEIVRTELRIRKKQLERLRNDASAIIARAQRELEEK